MNQTVKSLNKELLQMILKTKRLHMYVLMYYVGMLLLIVFRILQQVIFYRKPISKID